MFKGYYISGAPASSTTRSSFSSAPATFHNPLVSYTVPGLLQFPRLGAWLHNTYQGVNGKTCFLHVGCWFIPS